jgi:hypothetical protein
MGAYLVLACVLPKLYNETGFVPLSREWTLNMTEVDEASNETS